MSATGTKKGILEVFKFACYVGIPISMMSVFANNPDNLEKVIRNVSTTFISIRIKHVGCGSISCFSFHANDSNMIAISMNCVFVFTCELQRSYVVYPPEGPPLPPPEEIREMIRKSRAASESAK